MKVPFASILFLAFLSCKEPKEKVDLIIHNAKVYTVDSNMTIAESFAIKNGKITETGPSSYILDKYQSTNTIDLNGLPVYPGFIDAHCHFYGYGKGLQRADLTGTKSYNQVIERLIQFAKNSSSEWISGRGWDQNDWEIKEFPSKEKLDSLFPHTPVILTRVDGHAVLINSEAMRRAGITNSTKTDGGEIIKNKKGEPTGVLIDNAIELVAKVIPASDIKQAVNALKYAQENCFKVGLTTVDDAGLDVPMIMLIDSLQKEGTIKMRIYAMVSATNNNIDYYSKEGKYKTDHLNVCSFKFFADGALGSRGACLLHPYSDVREKTHYGFLLDSPENLKDAAEKVYKMGFQMNTHCIGDSANRLMLDIYAAQLKSKNDKRWRIEHAQVIHPTDFVKFAKYSVIPSVQPTHATSDMYWAQDRLGPERVKGAYAYKDMLSQFGKIACGSDFPVEDINPLYGFYAAIARMDQKQYPEGGFQPENAITRNEALKGMTIWAAYSNFEENEKGSIEPGKFADFVVLEKDIMITPMADIPSTKVLHTYVGGEKVHGK